MRTLMRLSQLSLLVVVVVFTMGAGDSNKRFEKLGHEIMCSCGCNQILLECNHVGCPSSAGMRDELKGAIAGGSIAGGIGGGGADGTSGGGGPTAGGSGDNSDSAILKAFVEKYGPTILAAPTANGFNRVAWIMPFAVLFLGLAGTALLVRKWRLRTVAMPNIPTSPGFKAIRDRVRRDTDF
jgi:cytochrome c-type biogenesis protein CcmH/NrfF